MDMSETISAARDAITVKRVYGEPYERNGIAVIPAAAVQGGGGGGGSEEGDRSDGGSGFGIQARPVGAYVIKGEDVKWVPAVDVNRLLAFAFVVSLAFALRR